MQILPIGSLQLPGTCYVCGNGTCDEGYMDFGTFVDYHGSFYLCVLCVKQAAETIGYFSPDEVHTTKSLMETIVADNERLTKELANARPILDSLSDFYRTTIQPSSILSSDTAESVDESRPFSQDDNEGPESAESDSTESDNRSGRSNSGRATKRNFTVVE